LRRPFIHIHCYNLYIIRYCNHLLGSMSDIIYALLVTLHWENFLMRSSSNWSCASEFENWNRGNYWPSSALMQRIFCSTNFIPLQQSLDSVLITSILVKYWEGTGQRKKRKKLCPVKREDRKQQTSETHHFKAYKLVPLKFLDNMHRKFTTKAKLLPLIRDQ
jgi:hypothetical protein